MATKSKQKGNRFEREIVKIFNDNDYQAKRAWGSNGMSLGLPEDVDVLIEELSSGVKQFKIQAKRRAALPKYLKLGNCDAVVIREDREVPLIMMPLMDFLAMIKE
jgi:Holliday junction resolvase